MTTLYVTEFAGLGSSNNGNDVQAVAGPPIVEQTVGNAGASTQSAAFNALTTLVRLHTDSICSVKIGGTNPVATTSSARMIAGQTEYFRVVPGDKLAVILNT
jgi:hypothetical protein